MCLKRCGCPLTDTNWIFYIYFSSFNLSQNFFPTLQNRRVNQEGKTEDSTRVWSCWRMIEVRFDVLWRNLWAEAPQRSCVNISVSPPVVTSRGRCGWWDMEAKPVAEMNKSYEKNKRMNTSWTIQDKVWSFQQWPKQFFNTDIMTSRYFTSLSSTEESLIEHSSEIWTHLRS